MCGRFSLTASPEEVAEFFGLEEVDGFPARYNIAPTQPILIVAGDIPRAPGDNRSNRRAMLVRWGLIPSWVKDLEKFPLLINARSESAAEKNSFRAAMRHRRVLVAASGFYEWHRAPKELKQKPVPYWIRPVHGGIVAFAGLMETYMSPDGAEVDTGAILTTHANPAIAPIHDRMPVVIEPQDFDRWLDCKAGEPRDVADLLKPAAPDFFEAIHVSDRVNKVANAGPDLQQPVAQDGKSGDSALARKPASAAPPPDQLKLF
jgi:putative SOS response-associated peptidase YedK